MLFPSMMSYWLHVDLLRMIVLLRHAWSLTSWTGDLDGWILATHKKKLSYLTSRDLPSFLRGERLNFRVYMGGWVVEDWLASLPMDEDVVGVYL